MIFLLRSLLEQETHLAAAGTAQRLDVLFVSAFDGYERSFAVVAHVGLLARQAQLLLLLLDMAADIPPAAFQ